MDEDLEDVLRRKDDGALSWICAVCSELGELVYCDLCKKGFHIDEQCLGSTEAPDEEEWICSDCHEATVECFACKETGSTASGGDIVVCSRRDCAKFFHEACLEDLEGITWGGPDEDHLVCPQHSCRACHHIMRASKLYKCLLCPVAYHEQCAPEGSHLLEEIPSHCICWRHDSDWKKQPKKLPQTKDVCEVFSRLAVPLVEIDFELPPEVLAGDSDDEGDVLRPSQSSQPQAEPAGSSVHEVTPEAVPEITKKVDTGGRSDMQSKKAEVSASKRGWKDALKVEEGERECQAAKKVKMGESGVREEAGSSDGQEVGMHRERVENGREAETSGRGAAEAGGGHAEHEDVSHVHIDQNVWLVRRSTGQDLSGNDAAAPSFSHGKKLEVSKVRESEWVVTAAEDIAADEIVVEYVGEVVDSALCEQRMAVLEKKRVGNPHLCQLDDSLVLDAYYKGNLSRFVPHSTRPNCQLQRWRVDGELRVGLFARKAINKGDPVTYDYKAIPFGSHSVADFPLRVPAPCDQPTPQSPEPVPNQSTVPDPPPSEPPQASPDAKPDKGPAQVKPEETAGTAFGSQSGTEKLNPSDAGRSPDERVLSPERTQLPKQHSTPIDGDTGEASGSPVGLAPRQRSITPADVKKPSSVVGSAPQEKVELGPQMPGLVIDVRPEPETAVNDANVPGESQSGERSGERPDGEVSGDADESAEVLTRRRVGNWGAVVREDSDEAEEETGTTRRGEKKSARSEDEEKRHADFDSPRDGREARNRRDEKRRVEGKGRGEDEPRRPRVSLRGSAGRKQTPGEERLERRERLRKAQEDSPQGAGLARELRRLGAKDEKTPGKLDLTPGRGGSAGRRGGSPERGVGEKRRAKTEEEGGLREGDERLPNKKRGRPPSKKRIVEAEAERDIPLGPEPSRTHTDDGDPSAAPTPVSPAPARPSGSHTAQSSPPVDFPPPAQPVVSASIATSPVPGELGGGRAEGSERAPPEQEPSGAGPLAAAESAAVGGAKNGRHDDHEEAASPHIPWPREGVPLKIDPDDEGDEKPARDGGRRNGLAADEREANGRRELRDEWARRPRRVPKWGGRRSRYWVPGYPLNWTAASYLQQHNHLPAPPIET